MTSNSSTNSFSLSDFDLKPASVDSRAFLDLMSIDESGVKSYPHAQPPPGFSVTSNNGYDKLPTLPEIPREGAYHQTTSRYVNEDGVICETITGISSEDSAPVTSIVHPLQRSESVKSDLSGLTEQPLDPTKEQVDSCFREVGAGAKDIQRAILTFFPPTTNRGWLRPSTYFQMTAQHKIKNWCGQFEKCPTTGKLHAHVFVEFVGKLTFNKIRSLFKEQGLVVSVSKSHKNGPKPKQYAINYCLDPRKRLNQGACYIWEHCKDTVKFDRASAKRTAPNATKSQFDKKKDEQEAQRLWIESRPIWKTWDEIVHESEDSKVLLATCGWGKSYHNGRHVETPRRIIKDVVLLYGAGGTGKTTYCIAYDKQDDPTYPEPDSVRYYRRNAEETKFWDGGSSAYKGQRVVHFEEFVGGEPFGRMKEVCDIGHHGPDVAVKNGGTHLNHHTVLISSNVHPAGWYHNLWGLDPKQFHPFWRRVTKVLFFPSHRPDGSLNRPDDQNPPHYIDQTDEWKEMEGDYAKCKEHAQRYWPLKEVQAMTFTPGHTFTEPHIFQYSRTGRDPTA